jgi:chemotaxis protein MotC
VRGAGLAAVVIVATLHIGVARAEEFATMVLELNALQNRMATGDAAARERAAKQFDLIEKTIDSVEPDRWLDERNLRAAIVYLLCGGAPSKLREIHEAGFPGEKKLASLLGASVAYADGREGGMPKALMEINPRDFPAVLGGHVALVQGGALMSEDSARAISLLDLARLLMPGSLVEEAALRREIGLLDPVRDSGKVAMLAGRYIAKYAASPYAQSFWDSLRLATVDRDSFLDRSASFEPVFDKAPAERRLTLYLALARRALQAGNFDTATRFVDKAATGATGGDARKRIDAYRGVVQALTQERGADALRTLATDRIEKEDAALVATATGVLTRLAARSKPERSADDAPYEMLDTVRRALSESDALLQRSASP